jgi:hypothetical protein
MVASKQCRAVLVAAIGIGLSLVAVPRGSAAHAGPTPSGEFRVGHARFEVVSPTLIRLEYSATDHFENRSTLVAGHPRRRESFAIAAGRRHGWFVMSTGALTLRYRLGSGRFNSHNVVVTSRTSSWRAHPTWRAAKDPKNLGGWVRALDNDSEPVALHPGLLSRRGWFLLNDSRDPVLTHNARGFATRPSHGRYQDGYFFGYGGDFQTALQDLRNLTGPAPLLPRSAFGVWFSRYFPYSGADYHSLLRSFRTHRVPLDTLSIDTDWKRAASPLAPVLAGAVVGSQRAYSWNGWEWNHSLFPDPHSTIAWLHQHGIDVALNIHPSIDSSDPQYAATVARTGSMKVDPTCTVEQVDPTGLCHVFDLTQPRQVAAYFALHRSIAQAGVDEWWLDWCCDATTIDARGLTPDTWFNQLYTKYLQGMGSRWLVLSRVGGSYQGGDSLAGPGDGIFAEHRYAIHFTGDTCATWPMLAFEAQFTAEEGNIGLPYVSHDIGSFHGVPVAGQCGPVGTSALSAHLPDDLYVRWVELGTFQPLDRLHSDHGDRLPWSYGPVAEAAATRFLRLRAALVPYLYSLAKEAHDTGLPMARGLYLQWPDLDSAYEHPSEYTLGRDVVVVPVTAPGDPAPVTVWVPPGTWVDYFTRDVVHGPAVVREHVPLDRIPLLVRPRALGRLPALR